MTTTGISRKEYRALCAQAEQQHKAIPDCRKKDNLDFFLYFITVLTVLFALRLFLAEPVEVVGSSMYPTLHNGERMAVEKASLWFEAPARGEIIICRYPEGEVVVKRVIGLPGETVEVINGVLLIDGEPLDESAYWQDVIERDAQATLVPQDSVYVVGDNRNHSDDSRRRYIGCVPNGRILGRVRGVFWPIAGLRGI